MSEGETARPFASRVQGKISPEIDRRKHRSWVWVLKVRVTFISLEEDHQLYVGLHILPGMCFLSSSEAYIQLSMVPPFIIRVKMDGYHAGR